MMKMPMGSPPGVSLSGLLAVATCTAAAGCAAPHSLLRPQPVVERLGTPAREPMLVQHPDGSLFLAGYGASHPTLWRSRDGGASWDAVDVGDERRGAIGNSDVDLAVAADGTLYFAAMLFDRKLGEGRRIGVGTSRDGGATWSWQRLSETRFDDRPWVEVAPDGTAHAIWNDGAGVRHAVSTDRGRRWRERARIHPRGGSSHLAVGPRGELAVRIIPYSASGNRADAGVDLVAVSADGGMTWAKVPAPIETAWEVPITEKTRFTRWVDPVAWDHAGVLYTLAPAAGGLWLAHSADHGATWTTARIVETGEVVAFPYLVARGAGELLATWFSGDGESTLTGHVALLAAGADGAPRVVAQHAFEPDSWIRQPGSEPSKPDPAGEYLAAAFLRDGDYAVVSPVQNPAAKRFGFAFRRLSPSRR